MMIYVITYVPVIVLGLAGLAILRRAAWKSQEADYWYSITRSDPISSPEVRAENIRNLTWVRQHRPSWFTTMRSWRTPDERRRSVERKSRAYAARVP